MAKTCKSFQHVLHRQSPEHIHCRLVNPVLSTAVQVDTKPFSLWLFFNKKRIKGSEEFIVRRTWKSVALATLLAGQDPVKRMVALGSLLVHGRQPGPARPLEPKPEPKCTCVNSTLGSNVSRT